MTTPLLEIKNLHANVEGHDILKGVNLTVHLGEVGNDGAKILFD